jgi:uncharacterized protein (TIGR02001 family)
MRNRLLTAAILLALAAPAFAQDEEAVEEDSGPWSFNIGAVSDYAFRGVSQTNEGPALQGGVDFNHDSGFHAGAWASNVDFVDGDGANIELDLYAGWGTDINDVLSIDATLIHYFYIDQNAYEYNELLVKMGVTEYVTFLLGYSNDVFGSDETGIYYQVAGSYPLPWGDLNLTGSLGHYDLDDALGDSYNDQSVGLSHAFGPMNVTVAYVHASNDVDWGQNGGSRTTLSAVWAF